MSQIPVPSLSRTVCLSQQSVFTWTLNPQQSFALQSFIDWVNMLLLQEEIKQTGSCMEKISASCVFPLRCCALIAWWPHRLIDSSSSSLLLSFLRLDSVHKRDECEHPSAGWHTVWEDHQHQLGGCLQVPHCHTPSDGLWQWGQNSSYSCSPLWLINPGITWKIKEILDNLIIWWSFHTIFMQSIIHTIYSMLHEIEIGFVAH